MTQLPALPPTLIEAEALAFARDWIAGQRDPNGGFHPDAERLFGKPLMKHVAQFHPFLADDIVYFAEKGNEQACLALNELIGEYEDQGKPLTAVLAAYDIRQRNPLRRRKKPGRKKADHGQFVRDIGIVVLVEQLTRKFGLAPNLKKSSGKVTASCIVADALRDAGIDVLMTAKNVERIWRRYLPALSVDRPVGCIGLFDQRY
jgi:hypothetical protein